MCLERLAITVKIDSNRLRLANGVQMSTKGGQLLIKSDCKVRSGSHRLMFTVACSRKPSLRFIPQKIQDVFLKCAGQLCSRDILVKATSVHLWICICQSDSKAIGCNCLRQRLSRPLLMNGKPRTISWIFGESKRRFMICVTLARVTWPSVAISA